ncbi:hypothetical protein OAV81_06025 [Candidatus Thioglobus sp.]|nr:hypothetical protein [Candidatus Thioglobus sp.]
MTNNRWFEVYITDGLDKYYEKSTILGIYILTLKVRVGEPSAITDRYIHPPSHIKRNLDINPIQRLIEIAESDEASLDQRINCYKEIAEYTYPRLKFQELWVSPVENLAPTVIELVAGTGTST